MKIFIPFTWLNVFYSIISNQHMNIIHPLSGENCWDEFSRRLHLYPCMDSIQLSNLIKMNFPSYDSRPCSCLGKTFSVTKVE